MTLDKIVVVKKQTRLEELVRRYLTTAQVKFYLESRGHSYDEYREADSTYKASLRQILAKIPRTMRKQVVDVENIATFQFGDNDLVATVGGTGLIVNVAKYVGKQPVIAVNADEKRNDNILFSCGTDNFVDVLKRTLEGNVAIDALTMAEAQLDDGQIMYALNDLFIGKKTHVSARYEIEFAGRRECQSTSGIVVSTGTGSTGWLASFVAYIGAVTNHEGLYPYKIPFPRDKDYLIFNVREPFPSGTTSTKPAVGKITKSRPLIVHSMMPEDGVIFSDGIEKDYIEFNSGTTAVIKPSEKKVYLVRG